jgi:hypothetical protein
MNDPDPGDDGLEILRGIQARQEADRWLREAVEKHGRDTIAGFLRWLASRHAADSPSRQRGYRDPLPTNGRRTRTDCQRGEGNSQWPTPD